MRNICCPELVATRPPLAWAAVGHAQPHLGDPGRARSAPPPSLPRLAFERLIELVLATAPEAAAIRRLNHELAHTMRQINVLKQHVAVELGLALVRVRRTLDEREREEAVRLRRIAAGARAGRPGV